MSTQPPQTRRIELPAGEHVLDVGAGENPHEEATITADIRVGVADYAFDAARDEWPFPDGSLVKIVAQHVLEHFELEELEHFVSEAGRVLIDGGRLEIAVPLGLNADVDLDHVDEWEYRTPILFCKERQRPWDPETEFVLAERDLDVWLSGPLGPLTSLFRLAAKRWPEWAARRCFCGKLRATFEKRPDYAEVADEIGVPESLLRSAVEADSNVRDHFDAHLARRDDESAIELLRNVRLRQLGEPTLELGVR